MLKFKEDIGKVDDNGDSWEKVKEEVEVATDDKSQMLKILTEIVINAYVFKTQWSSIVTNNANSLKPMAVVQVWSFRKPNSKLGFVMIKVKNGEDGHVIN
ncbi:hypothetical protein REPUB_Repub05bG0042400 [Reevesia pubescens]